MFPEITPIDRTSTHAWSHPEVRAAVEATGRKKLIMAGISTEVCLAQSVLAALKDGYEVYFVSDCSAGGWISVSHGRLRVPEPVDAGELAIFESSDAAVDCTAEADAEFVVGSAVPHAHDLALGNYSVHTSPAALREGERWLGEIQRRLRNEGRL